GQGPAEAVRGAEHPHHRLLGGRPEALPLADLALQGAAGHEAIRYEAIVDTSSKKMPLEKLHSARGRRLASRLPKPPRGGAGEPSGREITRPGGASGPAAR